MEVEHRAFSIALTSFAVFSSALFCSFLLMSSTMRTLVTVESTKLVKVLNLGGILTLRCTNTPLRITNRTRKIKVYNFPTNKLSLWWREFKMMIYSDY